MASGYKIRIADGSEIGPMDLAAVRTWLAQGLIDRNSPVLPPGTKKLTTLGQVKELASIAGAARPSSALKAAAKAAAAPSATAVPRGEMGRSYSDWSERWRTLLVGILFFLGAGAAGYLNYRPQHALPEFDGAPWLQIALVQLAFGLALVPGWELGRKIVRVAVILVAIGIFPLTGILVAQGVRGPALIALAAAWVLASGLFAFLSDSMAWLKAALCLVPVLGGAYGIARFGYAAETEPQRQVREWTASERRFADDALGVALDVPPGWVILKKGNPLVASPSDVAVALAQPRAGAFAYFVAESSPKGVASLDGYLDRALAARRKAFPALSEKGRADVTVGRLSGRKAMAFWESDGVRYRDATTVWKDGWVYFALVSWLPEAAPSRAVEEMDTLAAGFSTTGALATRLQQAVETVTQEVPQLSPAAAEFLMGQSAAQVLEPDQAFRRSLDALTRALPTWSAGDTQEMSQLVAATYATLPWKDRNRLAVYIDKVRAGQLTSPPEDREMAQLMKGAVLQLPPLKKLRLQALYEKAVRSAMAPSLR